MILLILVKFAVLLAGCAEFKNSPFTDELQTNTRNWNARNVAKIQALNLNDTFRIATISDTHSNYNDLRAVIREINSRSDIDFVIHLGDFTDRGYNFEYDIFVDIMKGLNKPSVVVIGNHDSIGKGPQLYRRVFGNPDFTFDFNGTKIIIANNNRLDFISSWSADWMFNEVAHSQGFDRVIVAHHVDPDSTNYFTTAQVMQFDKLYSDSKVNLVLNGHQHTFLMRAMTDYLSLQVPRIQDRQYNILDFKEGELHVWYCQKGHCRTVAP
ncbi:metallophosphoesterase [Bdellovibrio bacteriovorus]|uniref:metallophosphoesterase family protein n=1 Tax=Bdellovibrio bacteriovorus TaxID=959 RepID=UPI0021CF5A3D|nr:metallophosphoesterase [Bdellovibrio bacteriovorus]UXR66037.1 metallophosphoesterase [Bdellovibrio bacteriovorus]